MSVTRFYLALFLGVSAPAIAKDTVFNPALLEIDHPVNIDISQFNRANTLPPGEYKVDILVNGKFVEKRDITFIQPAPDTDLQPCFLAVKEVLASFGVKVQALKTLANVDEKACLNPQPLVDGSLWTLDADKLVLNVSVPQIWLDQAAQGYIPPSRWDQGINALLVNYDFSGSRNLKSDYDENDFYYLNLQGGVNIGAWRLRNYSTLNADGSDMSYHSVSTYLQRDIAALRSQIMLGDTWTAGDIFDSSRVRGLRLYTDNDMLPSSQTGFAPVVRGVAKSNATVIIRQNGYVIYQSAVPQGAFEITDMNTVHSGGDLDVTIKEEDGSEQHFTQPYATLAILKREGQTDVDISLGELRDRPGFSPTVLQAEVLRGMPWGTTLYGGVQAAEEYASAALGIGKDMGSIGAVSFDITHAQSRFDDGDEKNGQSWRFLYSKRFDDTGTAFRLVGYRYSTEGYYTLSEWASRQSHDGEAWSIGNRRSRLEGTWTQAFARGWGNMYLTLSRQEYWQTDAVERLLQLGYSNYWRQIAWNLAWNYTDDFSRTSTRHSNQGGDNSEHVFLFSVSVPLSGWLSNSHASYSMSQNNHNDNTHQVGLSGTLLDDRNLSYTLQQSYTHDNRVWGGSAGLSWDGTYGSLNGGYAYSQNSQRLNYGGSGGILAHSDGVTFSQRLGETVALVKAPGAQGLKVENATGVATDWRGYTVKTQLSPYDENRVAINSDYFAQQGVELDESVKTLIPTRGAVVKAEFATRIGHRVLFTLRRENGEFVPFGALATSENGAGGIVGESGEIYLAGMSPSGTFSLKWGREAGQRCGVKYQFNAEEKSPLIETDAICRKVE